MPGPFDGLDFHEVSIRAGTRHLFSRDAEYFRERRSWRCVGRRREEPAARRRPTNGPFHLAFLSSRELLPLPRQNPRSLSPHFIVSRVSSFTTWVTACDGSPCGRLRRRVTVTGFGIRQNLANPQLKDGFIESEKHLLARPPMRKAKCQLFLGTTSRGACVAPLRARLASVLVGAERPRGHMEPLSSSGELRTLSLASCCHRRGATSKIHAPKPGAGDSITESEHANARLSPLESEASSEAGSFRRRAPVAAFSSLARAANDSDTGPGHAFFRVRLEWD